MERRHAPIGWERDNGRTVYDKAAEMLHRKEVD